MLKHTLIVVVVLLALGALPATAGDGRGERPLG